MRRYPFARTTITLEHRLRLSVIPVVAFSQPRQSDPMELQFVGFGKSFPEAGKEELSRKLRQFECFHQALRGCHSAENLKMLGVIGTRFNVHFRVSSKSRLFTSEPLQGSIWSKGAAPPGDRGRHRGGCRQTAYPSTLLVVYRACRSPGQADGENHF